MESLKVYEALAEHVFFDGLTEKQLLQTPTKYKPGKTFKDVKEALAEGRRAGMGDGSREIASMGERLSRVLDIDETSAFRYRQLLNQAKQTTTS